MKTPDETKKGLECCILETDDTSLVDHCKACPYQPTGLCFRTLLEDALAYIRKLEEREWELFDLLSSAWFTKACYFKQDDGTVYSRMSGEYMTFDQAIDEFTHDLVEATQLEAQVPKWISVEERLPEHGRYLVITRNDDGVTKMHTATYNDMGWWTCANFGEITHWMELPEGPKEG